MTKPEDVIRECEEKVERALWSLEREERLDDALSVYREVEAALEILDLNPGTGVFNEQQRVLAYCLMRQGNALRQLGEAQEALALSEREIAAARASENEIACARSLMSGGVNHIVSNGVEQGVEMLEEARTLFAQGDSIDHRQGLGWFWILRADLINGGLVAASPEVAVEAAAAALEVLLPIENWAGVARAHAARAQAHEKMGKSAAAAADRTAQQEYEHRSRTREREA